MTGSHPLLEEVDADAGFSRLAAEETPQAFHAEYIL